MSWISTRKKGIRALFWVSYLLCILAFLLGPIKLPFDPAWSSLLLVISIFCVVSLWLLMVYETLSLKIIRWLGPGKPGEKTNWAKKAALQLLLLLSTLVIGITLPTMVVICLSLIFFYASRKLVGLF